MLNSTSLIIHHDVALKCETLHWRWWSCPAHIQDNRFSVRSNNHCHRAWIDPSRQPYRSVCIGCIEHLLWSERVLPACRTDRLISVAILVFLVHHRNPHSFFWRLVSGKTDVWAPLPQRTIRLNCVHNSIKAKIG